jgi:hypothetical protein
MTAHAMKGDREDFKEDPSTLVTIPVERTMTGGKWVYES